MQPTAFYLLTDTHFVSKSVWEDGKPFTLRERGDQIALKLSPEILDAFLDIIIADAQTDTVVFLGDNVNGGDMASHYAFCQRLERLRNNGKKVYVTYATHDYCGLGDDENFFKPYRYTAQGCEPVPAMRKDQLFDFYADYGVKQALSVHRESGSYTVQLGDGVRLIAVIDNGNGRSHCGLFEDGMQWLTQQIRQANAAGDRVLLAVHHPVLPPWEVYRHLADYEMLGGYRELTELLCAENVHAVFTGHTHVQSIKKYTDNNGGWFLDIATTAAVNAAGKMRRVCIDDGGICTVSSIGIDRIDGVDFDEPSLYAHLYGLNFPGIWERLLPLAVSDYPAFLALAEGYLPTAPLQKHRRLIRFAAGRLQKATLYSAARLAGCRRALSPEQRREAKDQPITAMLFDILRHIYTGNAPYTPDTAENIIATALMHHADVMINLFRIKKLQALIPDGMTLAEMAQDFLYNNRTGDDDAVSFSLR